MNTLFFFLGVINIIAYSVMALDKLKSLYQWWRIPEKTLWMLALCGGVFGIWLAMRYPLYHKAGKRSFRVGTPVIALIWIILICFLFFRDSLL